MTSKTTQAAARAAHSTARSPAPRARAEALRLTVMARAADQESRGVRRGLQIALGLIWLLDAALQFQPYMYSRSFVSQVLEPTAMGNPAVLASPALWADRLISHNLPVWNTASALTQLAIALGLLWRPTVKAALAISIAWSLGVWWVAEGLGGVLTGTASPVTGAPGAVILYALIAISVWPRRSGVPGNDGTGHGGVAAASPLGRRWSTAAWLVLWASFAYLIVQPAVRAPRALSGTLTGEAADGPGWLAALDRGAAAAAGSHGLAISVVLAIVFVFIAAGILFPATARPALALAMIAGLAIWVAGENFGEILTGTGTDPNSGPLLILLAAAYWPLPSKISPDPGTADLATRRLAGGRQMTARRKVVARKGLGEHPARAARAGTTNAQTPSPNAPRWPSLLAPAAAGVVRLTGSSWTVGA